MAWIALANERTHNPPVGGAAVMDVLRVSSAHRPACLTSTESATAIGALADQCHGWRYRIMPKWFVSERNTNWCAYDLRVRVTA